MIASVVPISGVQTINSTEWCTVYELLEKSIIVLNTAIKHLSKGETSSVSIWLST